MKNQRVYVIDYELISPIAFGRDQIHSNLVENITGEGLSKRVFTDGLPFKVTAEINEALEYLYQDEHERIRETCSHDRKFELLVACYYLAKDRFENICQNLSPSRGGVVLGIGADVVDVNLFENEILDLHQKTDKAYSELIAGQNTAGGMLNKIWNSYDIYSLFIAEKFRLAAFQKSILTACTSSTQAIISAFDSIRFGECDLVITGGTDSIINSVALASFGKLGVIPPSEGIEGPTCLTFDVNRQGTLAGEAAGLLVLVSESYVSENILNPIAEIVSYGNTLDGYKITAPDPEGTAIKRALTDALNIEDFNKEEINYIQAHGTATRHNDPIELNAIDAVLGAHAKKVSISSTKDRHGHAIGAAGIQEFNLLMNCFENSFMPANRNMKNPIREDMNLLQKNIFEPIKYALTNNFAFGGVNSVLLIKNLS